MEAKEMIEFLKQESIRVIDEDQNTYRISHTCNDTVIYFWQGSFYSSYNNDDETNDTYLELLKWFPRIIRIEKEMDSEYFPIWTKEDGEIMQGVSFVKLKGRYYTINFLEKLIDQIREIKNINI